MENVDEHKRQLLWTESDDEFAMRPTDFPTQTSRKLVLRSSITFSGIVVLSTIVYLVLFLRWTLSTPTCGSTTDRDEGAMANDPALFTCGSTRDEAKARGCIFDVLSVGWVPAACFDKQRSDTFEKMATIVSYGKAGQFPWYLDANHTIPIAESDLSELADHPVAYTTEEFHQQHCLYMWQTTSNALHEARTQNKSVWALDRVSDPHHNRHCLIVLESMPSRYNKSVEVDFGYRDCVRLDIR